METNKQDLSTDWETKIKSELAHNLNQVLLIQCLDRIDQTVEDDIQLFFSRFVRGSLVAITKPKRKDRAVLVNVRWSSHEGETLFFEFTFSGGGSNVWLNLKIFSFDNGIMDQTPVVAMNSTVKTSGAVTKTDLGLDISAENITAIRLIDKLGFTLRLLGSLT